MEWNTPVSIDLQQGAVTHHHRMMLFGSCFAEHIGTRLGEFHFRVDVNPFGIQYNPLDLIVKLLPWGSPSIIMSVSPAFS